MTPMPWLRLYHRIIDDEKVRLLAFEDRWHFVAVLCLKADGLMDEPDGGLKWRKIAVKMGVQTRELDEIKRRLSEVGLVDENMHPIAWDVLQYKSDSSTDRVRKHRGKAKASRDETLRNVSVTPPDTDTDTESTPKGPSQGHEVDVDLSGMSGEIRDYASQGINRSMALGVRCQHCKAPANAPCVGTDGKARRSHIERYQLVAHLRKAPKESDAIDWPARVKAFREDDIWPHSWGPKPGEPGCKALLPLDQEDPLRSIIERAGHSFIVGKTGKAWLPYNVIEKARAELPGAA